jgi:hypothetical protein
MKNLIFILLTTISSYAQCPETTIQEAGEVIAKQQFNISQPASEKEQILHLTAFAENTSWAKRQAESAVLTIFLAGKYNQDLILFHGADKFVYQVVLGKLPAGKHELKIVSNRKRTAQNSGAAKISAIKIRPFSAKTSAQQKAVAHAPFLVARPETIDKFSDIPLITFYEILPVSADSYKIRYTTIFSNEDGGTQTTALMARWGRTTDIEWVYEIEFEKEKIISEKFQGANHVTQNFNGQRIFGAHPLIFNVTVNNNFADAGCSALRTAQLPIRADLTHQSRETVMDENTWTYRIMAQEAMREGRINPEKLDANTIADLRDYVFAEIYNEPNQAAISLETQTPDGKFYSSDFGNKLLRVDRRGYSRIALLFPQNARPNSPLKISVVCHAKEANSQTGDCQKLNLLKIVTLDQNFQPQEFKVASQPHNLLAGEKADFTVKLLPFGS